MSRPRWYADRSAAAFDLEAGDGRHRVTWCRGRLTLHDHDVEAEAVLRALGGEPCPCLLVLDVLRDSSDHVAQAGVWRRVAGWGSSLAGPGWARATSPVPQRPFPPPLSMAMAIEQMRKSPRVASMPQAQQAALLAQMRRRLVLELMPQPMMDVIGQASELRRERRMRSQRSSPPEPAGAWARLQAAAAAACEEAMRRARRDLRPYASVRVECRRRRADEPLLLQGALDGAGGSLALSLSVSWLNQVWGRGLAVVDGHFVLDVDRPAPAVELEGLAIRWERRLAGPSAPSAVACRLRRRADRTWTLTW